MLTQPTLTEKIIKCISAIPEFVYIPATVPKMIRWIEGAPYRQHKRQTNMERRMRKRIKEALSRLEKTEILSYSQTAKSYRLTPKGWLKYLYYYSQHKVSHKVRPTKNNTRKYLVLFDIPEKHRRFRDLLRQSLINQDCKMVQRSVFVCSNKVVFEWAKKVVCNCELEGHVLFIEASKIY